MGNLVAKTLAPILVGVALGLAAVSQVAGGGALAAAVQRCGGEGNTVQAAFELKEARAIWDHLPALGISPELESDTRPAEVVVFAGQYRPTNVALGNGPAPTSMQGVVCVVQEDGTLNLYTDVSQQGASFPH